MSFRLADDKYYEARPVPHTAQGDLFSGVALPVYVGDEPDRDRGARKRPLAFLIPPPTEAGMFAPLQELLIICSYTCNFVAQPPGSVGYSHPLRMAAPVVPLINMVSQRGMQKGEARRLKDVGYLSGLLYLPKPPGFTPSKPVKSDPEFTADDYAVLLFAVGSVHQTAVDAGSRVARLSQDAQKLLIAGLIGEVGPSVWDPADLEDPDMTSSW